MHENRKRPGLNLDGTIGQSRPCDSGPTRSMNSTSLPCKTLVLNRLEFPWKEGLVAAQSNRLRRAGSSQLNSAIGNFGGHGARIDDICIVVDTIRVCWRDCGAVALQM